MKHIVILLMQMLGKHMNKKIIKTINHFHHNKDGLSIVEAIAAAFIVSIGFISIYNLSSVITAQSINSIEREKITMLSNGMMEEFYENDALASTFFDSNNSQNESQACNMTGSGANKNTKHEFILKRWCDKNKSQQGGIGNGNANDIRTMTSRTITKNGRNMVVITYQISSKGGQANKIIRKIINK